MAGSSARSEGTSPSQFTMATLAPWLRKYLWAQHQGLQHLCQAGTCVDAHTCGSRPSTPSTLGFNCGPRYGIHY